MAIKFTCGGVEHPIDSLGSLTFNAGCGLTSPPGNPNAITNDATVTATNDGDGHLTLTRAGTSVPPAPLNVLATDGLSGLVTVTWDAAPTAVTYKLYRNLINSSVGATLVAAEIAALTCNDTGGTAGLVYYYFVVATNAGGDSNFSASDAGYKTALSPFINDLYFRDLAETPVEPPWHSNPVTGFGTNKCALNLGGLTTRTRNGN
jgi:hypothetical protein